MLRLNKRAQFQRVYKKGESYKENHIALCLLPNELTHNRIGISVTSRIIPLSVRRNRCKRLLLESYRLTEDLLKKGYDMVFISTIDISNSGLGDVKTEVIKLYKRSGILI